MDAFAPFQLRRATPADIDDLMRIDDDAARLFERHGFEFSGPGISAFVAAERARWLQACERDLAQLVVDPSQRPVAFSVLAFADGRPYLDQLSVVLDCMGRGLGRALLEHAFAWAAPLGELWLTTYAHVSWNAPMYTRAGFVRVDEAQCGPEIRAILDEQRAALPDPGQRIAMRRRGA